MRAVRAHDRVVEVVDVPRPAGDGVRVRIRSAGICGSDLHLVDTGFPLGHTLGHELAGVTPDGTAVAIEPILPCGECANCHARRLQPLQSRPRHRDGDRARRRHGRGGGGARALPRAVAPGRPGREREPGRAARGGGARSAPRGAARRRARRGDRRRLDRPVLGGGRARGRRARRSRRAPRRAARGGCAARRGRSRRAATTS